MPDHVVFGFPEASTVTLRSVVFTGHESRCFLVKTPRFSTLISMLLLQALCLFGVSALKCRAHQPICQALDQGLQQSHSKRGYHTNLLLAGCSMNQQPPSICMRAPNRTDLLAKQFPIRTYSRLVSPYGTTGLRFDVATLQAEKEVQTTASKLKKSPASACSSTQIASLGKRSTNILFDHYCLM